MVLLLLPPTMSLPPLFGSDLRRYACLPLPKFRRLSRYLYLLRGMRVLLVGVRKRCLRVNYHYVHFAKRGEKM